MCRSMVDIQSAAAEIRRGKKMEEERKIETTGQKYNIINFSMITVNAAAAAAPTTFTTVLLPPLLSVFNLPSFLQSF